jgi:hypothetical protein
LVALRSILGVLMEPCIHLQMTEVVGVFIAFFVAPLRWFIAKQNIMINAIYSSSRKGFIKLNNYQS